MSTRICRPLAILARRQNDAKHKGERQHEDGEQPQPSIGDEIGVDEQGEPPDGEEDVPERDVSAASSESNKVRGHVAELGKVEGLPHGGQALRSFGINPGGYVGFFNPETAEHETVSLQGDAEAKRRLMIKTKYKGARRSVRYQRSVTEKVMQTHAPVPEEKGITVLRRSGRRGAPRDIGN
jgi:hypothetical protein